MRPNHCEQVLNEGRKNSFRRWNRWITGPKIGFLFWNVKRFSKCCVHIKFLKHHLDVSKVFFISSKQGRTFELKFILEFEYEYKSWIYYTFVFVFVFDLGVSLVSKKKNLPEKDPLNQGMESLVNCGPYLEEFTDESQVHVCKVSTHEPVLPRSHQEYSPHIRHHRLSTRPGWEHQKQQDDEYLY